MIKKNCAHCQKEFYVRNCQKDTAKYCSRECISKDKSSELICFQCGKIFRRGNKCKKSKKSFCSKDCLDKFNSENSKELSCTNCGKKVKVKNSQIDTFRFCSRKCQKEFYDHTKILQCVICGKEIYREQWKINQAEKHNKKTKIHKNYCSRECYENRSPKVEVTCGCCGKKFLIYPSRQKYYITYFCSKSCSIKFGPIGKLTEGKIVNNNYERLARSIRSKAKYLYWRKECLERDNFQCSLCGKKEKLTVHHTLISMYELAKKYNFDKEKMESDSDFYKIENGTTLCRSCHAKRHRENKG